MATYIQQGEFVDYTPSGAGVAAGDVVALGDDFFGVALRDIADGEKGALATGGIFEFVSTGTVAAGALVFWDAENERVSTVSADNTYIGRASAAAADNKCRVFLNATNIGEFTAITPGAAPVATQTAIAALTAADPTVDAADPTITAVNPAALTAATPAAITAANPAAITAANPAEATATVDDQDNTKLLADVAAIRAEVVKLVTDLTASRAEVVKLVTDLTATREELVKSIADVAAIRTQLVAAIADLATLRDSDKAIIDDVQAIKVSTEAGIDDLETLKTAVNAAKADLAAVVAALPSEVLA